MAPIYAPTIFSSSPCPILPIKGMARIEPEIAFVMNRDLPHRTTAYTEAEVRAAIRAPHLVLELIGPRYADPGEVDWAEQLADSIQNQGLFVGPLVKGGMDAGLDAFPVTLSGPGGVLSNTMVAMATVIRCGPLLDSEFSGGKNDGLRAGQIVTTGSYAGAIDVPLGQSLSVEFGDLGTIAVELVRARERCRRIHCGSRPKCGRSCKRSAARSATRRPARRKPSATGSLPTSSTACSSISRPSRNTSASIRPCGDARPTGDLATRERRATCSFHSMRRSPSI